MGEADYDIDKFITSIHGLYSGRKIVQRISVAVVVIMHLKVIYFELDDRNKCDVLSKAAIFAYI